MAENGTVKPARKVGQCLERSVGDFAIVIPPGPMKGEDFFANELQYAVWKLTGQVMPVRNKSAGADAFEVLVGGGAAQGYFTLATEGNKLVVRANDLFGSMEAARRLCTVYYGEQYRNNIHAGFCQKLPSYQDFYREKTAAHRVMFHNVWGTDAPIDGGRSRYAAAYHLAYGADAVCLNEFTGAVARSGVFQAVMEKGGYRAVPVPEGWLLPVWYRPDRVRLLDCACADFEMLNAAHGATVAVFEETDGANRRFMVAGIHLASAWDCPQVEKYYRHLNNMRVLFRVIGEMAGKWGDVHVVVGGDCNCRADGESYREFVRHGYADAFTLAEHGNDRCSCHGYPTYCEALGTFHADAPASDIPYANSIDHLFVSHADRVRVALYRVNQETIVPVISDHCPQMADFDLL